MRNVDKGPSQWGFVNRPDDVKGLSFR